jgi:hypothetical protein
MSQLNHHNYSSIELAHYTLYFHDKLIVCVRKSTPSIFHFARLLNLGAFNGW